MRNSGTIFKMPDNRLCIVYNDQPLFPRHQKILIHIVDEKYNRIQKRGVDVTLIKSIEHYRKEIKTFTYIGRVD